MALASRLAWLNGLILNGHDLVLSVATRTKGTRLRFVIGEHANVIDPLHRWFLRGLLQRIQEQCLSSAVTATDSGHRFSCGRSEVCIWLRDRAHPLPQSHDGSPHDCSDNADDDDDDDDDGDSKPDDGGGNGDDGGNHGPSAGSREGHRAPGVSSSTTGTSNYGYKSMPKRPRTHSAGASEVNVLDVEAYLALKKVGVEDLDLENSLLGAQFPPVPSFVVTVFAAVPEVGRHNLKSQVSDANPVHQKSVTFANAADVLVYDIDALPSALPSRLLPRSVMLFIDVCFQQFLAAGELMDVHGIRYTTDLAARECFCSFSSGTSSYMATLVWWSKLSRCFSGMWLPMASIARKLRGSIYVVCTEF